MYYAWLYGSKCDSQINSYMEGHNTACFIECSKKNWLEGRINFTNSATKFMNFLFHYINQSNSQETLI
jgi:hypothetical protein